MNFTPKDKLTVKMNVLTIGMLKLIALKFVNQRI